MDRRRSVRMGQNSPANASGEANAGPPEHSLGSCQFCLKEIKRYRPTQRFCGNRCRLLYWAAGQIAKERELGNAEGIRLLMNRMK